MVGVHVGSAVLVTGDTMALKDKLKGVGGGQWNKQFGGWLFPESKRAEVTAALEDAGATIHAGAAAEPAPAEPSVDANAQLVIAPHKKAILVTGDTKKVKEQLMALRGSWNKFLCGWCFPGSRRSEVLALLRADPTNTVTEAAASTPGAKRKAADDFVIDDDDSD